MNSSKLVLLVCLVFNAYAQDAKKTMIDCTVTEVVDSSVLEESLSVNEYPNVEVILEKNGGFTTWLGASLFKTDNNDEIVSLPTAGFRATYRITPSHGYEQITISTFMKKVKNKWARQGKIIIRSREEKTDEFGESKLIAELSCKTAL